MGKDSISSIMKSARDKRIQELINQGTTEEEILEIFNAEKQSDTILEIINHISNDTVKFYEETMFKISKSQNDCNNEFLAKIEQSWGKAFASFHTMYVMSLEFAKDYAEIVDTLSDSEKRNSIFTFKSLQYLHGRACQIYLEILCLMRNGFADGAYARWRSIFEIAVIGAFILNEGEKVAKAFFSTQNKEKDRYEWAKKSNKFANSRYLSFSKILNYLIEIGEWTDKWDDAYNLGNLAVHASSQGTFKRLSNWDGISECIPVGQSNYGLSTPAEHSAIMLMRISCLFFSVFHSEDSILYMKTLQNWVNIVRKHFFITAYELFDRDDLLDWIMENVNGYEDPKSKDK